MNIQSRKYARIRYTAIGALAALAAVGAVAGTDALATKSHPTAGGHRALVTDSTTKTPSFPGPSKARTSQPVNQQPFFNAVQQLASDDTITPAQSRTVHRDIRMGRIDTDQLASNGFTQSQIQAVEQALANAKRGLAQHPRRTAK